MSKETFVIVMRDVHNALFGLHVPTDRKEADILNELINAYISMIAGFSDWLYKELRVYLLSHKDATDADFEELYDTLTTLPAGDDQ